MRGECVRVKTIGVMSLFYLDKLNLGTLGSEILLQQNQKRREAEGKNVTLKVAEVYSCLL